MKDLSLISVDSLSKNTMTSKEIAEITGKRHADVIRDIRNILSQGVQETNFALSFIISDLPNCGSKKNPMYVLTKKGCLILASGYDAVLREKIINRWEELETKERQNTQTLSLPQTYLEALKALVASKEKRIEAERKKERNPHACKHYLHRYGDSQRTQHEIRKRIKQGFVRYEGTIQGRQDMGFVFSVFRQRI